MSFFIRNESLNAASLAIQDGRGPQFIEEMIKQQTDSGLSQRQAVFNLVTILDIYQKQNLESALVLIRHLKEWTKAHA